MSDPPKPASGMETELPTEIHVKIDPSLLPKPATGEWTVYSVMKLRQKHWHEEDKNNAIAIAHNAALAAERKKK